jgi:hypothetical protein
MPIAEPDRYALWMVYAPGSARRHFLRNFLQIFFAKSFRKTFADVARLYD